VSWLLHLEYHFLGRIDPQAQLQVRVVKAGTFTAYELDLASTSPYISIRLTPTAWCVEIFPTSAGEGSYGLRLRTAHNEQQWVLSPSTPIEELRLSARTENMLKRAGVLTVGQAMSATLEALSSVSNFQADSFTELTEQLQQYRFE